MSKKLTKQQYLAKKKIKQQINANKSKEKTGKYISNREISMEKERHLHELFNFAAHTREEEKFINEFIKGDK